MALLLAGRVVEDVLVDGCKVGLELAAIVELEQQLADVVGLAADEREIRILGEPEDLARLALDRKSVV